MKRRISHGQAMRSIFGRRRVTHRLGRRGAKRSSADFVTMGNPALVQATYPSVEDAGFDALAAKLARRSSG